MRLAPEFVLRIVLAGVLGAVVGLERARSGQSAGIRTNVMIAIASCLFTWLGIEVFSEIGTGVQDPARIAAMVVSGVGFLGAGTMLQTKNKIRGLTTAATIWLVAAVGMTVGVGEYLNALFVTFFALIALILLAPWSEKVKTIADEKFRAQKEYQKHLKESDEEKQKRLEAMMLWLELKKHDQDDDDDEHEDVLIED